MKIAISKLICFSPTPINTIVNDLVDSLERFLTR